jgi:hypothetical protein
VIWMTGVLQVHLELQSATVLTGAKLVYRIVNDANVPVRYETGPVMIERLADDAWATIASPAGWRVPFADTIESGAAGPWMTLEVPRNADIGLHRLTKWAKAADVQLCSEPPIRLAHPFTVAEDPGRI